MDDEYKGKWMETYTGKHFHFLNPKSEEVDIRDIAHHLSMLCRFTGAVKTFYSVAEHSVRVSRIVNPRSKMAALLHDAAEAYTNDMSRPLKYVMPKIEEIESSILGFIYKVFNITGYDWDEVREADDILLMTEGRDLMTNFHSWKQVAEPLHGTIVPMSPMVAEAEFLSRYYTLRED